MRRRGSKGAPRAMRLSHDERREQLVACAVRVFAKHGLVASTHAQVAAAAKVSVPAVFFYFATRDALVGAVLAEVERFYTRALASANDPTLPADRTLAGVARAMTGTLDTHPDYSRIWMEWSVSVRSRIWPRFLKLHGSIARTIAKVIERGQREGLFRRDIDPGDEATILVCASWALIQMKETGASPERMQGFQRSMVRSVVRQDEGGQPGRATRRPRAAKRRPTIQ